jgi:speckle-type POZ protein
MKKTSLIFGLLMLLHAKWYDTFAQQYASGVINFSSQYTSTSWSAMQATGAPNTYPNYGDLVTAWASLTSDGHREFIELSYSQPQIINEIWVYETYNPGAIDSVYVRYTGSSNWVLVWDTTAAALPPVSIIRKIKFSLTPLPVDAVRISLNSVAVSGWNEIDAVAILNNTTTYINELQNLNRRFGIYPNPSSGIFTIQTEQGGVFEILDITGRILNTYTIKNHTETIHTNLPTGTYFIREKASGATQKLIIK